jgi:hypothetical protein
VSEDAAQLSGSDFAIVAGVVAVHGPAATVLQAMKAPMPSGAEAQTIRTNATYRGKPAIVLAGADASGLMYAELDLADRIGWSAKGGNPFQFARDAAEKPFLKDRGVVAFTMNRAYFESHLHDEQFWVRYFDMFARDRINEFVLVFGYEDGGYMAPLYPYFFDVEGYPEIKVVGLTPEQQHANFVAFKTVLRLAAERGIRVKPGIWEHIYRGGGQKGAIPWASDGKQPAPGLVWGVTTQNVTAYTVAALRKFHQLFPEIKDVQFRLHNESGLLTSEVEPFWHEVFNLYGTELRGITLEFRAKGLPKSVIKDAQAHGITVRIDTKVWMEQMGLPYHPTHINKEDQANARHSYADLLEYPKTYDMNWTLWNGGSQRVLEWSDPEYARRLVREARLYDGPGLIVTEMEATKMLGEPHDAAPRDFVNAKYRYFDYEFERYWAFYRVWGRLGYNPEAAPDVWLHEYVQRFGTEAGEHVMKAQQLASRVMPRIVAACLPYTEFPTSLGWPEMKHEGSLPQFARLGEGSDIAQFMNTREEAASILDGSDTAMRRPEETSRWLMQTSDAILAEVAAVERTHSDSAGGKELAATLADAKILAALGRYYAWRQLAAVDYNLYKQAASLAAFDEAIANERNAIKSWKELVAAAGDVYSDDMAFGTSARGFPRHWKDELPAMEKEFGELVAERQAAVAKADAKSVVIPARDAVPKLPVVTFGTAAETKAVPGQDFAVETKVAAPEELKWIRLRYRHLNQQEDYLTAEMTRDTKTGLYSAHIPGGFITPRWDLMYYVEVVDSHGNGRIYPDLEVATPYLVVGVKR